MGKKSLLYLCAEVERDLFLFGQPIVSGTMPGIPFCRAERLQSGIVLIVAISKL